MSSVSFKNKVINQLSPREAMGLPARFTASRISECDVVTETLRYLSREELLKRFEDQNTDFKVKWGCAQLLALVGDPRLKTLDPQMIEIESGEALLGTSFEEAQRVAEFYSELGVLPEWIHKEVPRHQKTIPAFKIGKYPVTHQEFRDFLVDSDFDEIPSSWEFGQYPEHKANHPVYTVSEHAAEAYCQWLSKKTGRKFRLPKEAEWEYAARGTHAYEFPWGEAFDVNKCNTVEAAYFTSTPVGMFPEGVSPFGVHDMAGNVEEYVADDYRPYEQGPDIQDDLLLERQRYRVARGGSFTRFSDLARTARRHGRYNSSIYVMGFRLAEYTDSV